MPVWAVPRQAAEYRRSDAGAAAGLRAVLAGGFTSMVAVSGLLLAGATVADTGSLAPLAGAGGVLAVGTAGLRQRRTTPGRSAGGLGSLRGR